MWCQALHYNEMGAHCVWTTTAPTLSFKYRCRCPSTMCCSIFQKRFIHTYIRKRFFKNNKNILPSITRSNSAFILSRHAEDLSDRWQRGAKTSECQQFFFFPGLARNKTGLHPRACNFSSLKYTINNTYEKTIKCSYLNVEGKRKQQMKTELNMRITDAVAYQHASLILNVRAGPVLFVGLDPRFTLSIEAFFSFCKSNLVGLDSFTCLALFAGNIYKCATIDTLPLCRPLRWHV